MIRAALTAVFLAALPAVADEPKKPDYYPLAKGHKWEYACTTPINKFKSFNEVIKTENRKGVTYAELSQTVDGTDMGTVEITLEEKGLFNLGSEKSRWMPPQQFIALPPKNGTKWTWTSKSDGKDRRTVEYVLQEPVDVKVPAGTFKTVQVRSIQKFPSGGTLTATHWYADGVGEVKYVSSLDGFAVTSELVKFTPGK